MTGLKAIDDNTLEVTLKYPFADFEYVRGSPDPRLRCRRPQSRRIRPPSPPAPVGNGPFMIDTAWQHDQSIKLKAFADYYGTKPNIDGIDFKIFKDPETAFLEFKAGNLDWTQIPSGQIKATQAEYGTSDNGYTAQPRQTDPPRC